MKVITVGELKKLLSTISDDAIVRTGGVELVQAEFVQDLRDPAKRFFDLYSADDVSEDDE